MKILWTITWALAVAFALADASAAQDKSKDGVTGSEVFSSSTPGGGSSLESQGVTGERTPWFITHIAPSLPGVVNVVVTYYDSQESRDQAKEKEKEKDKQKKKDDKKKGDKSSDRPPVPTYDPRFYEYKDGQLVPKARPNSGTPVTGAMNSGSITANGGSASGPSDTTYDKFGNPSTATYDSRFHEYKDGKLQPKPRNSSGARATTDKGHETASIEGLVVPNTIRDRRSFSMTVPQSAGQVISFQTIDGVVVQQASTDKYGRVFLGAGLPAGTYLISSSGHGQPLGKILIQQGSGDVLENAPESMQLQNAPLALKLSAPWSLSGHNFNPDPAYTEVRLTTSGQTEAPIILAATEDQFKLAPIQQLQPGMAQLRVTNIATGESTNAHDLLLYNMQGHLEQRTMPSGSQTELVIATKPENIPLNVKATVASGPVDFGGGRKEAEGVTRNGQLILPVHAERGAGPFQIDWSLVLSQPCPEEFSPMTQDEKTKHENNANAEGAAGDTASAGANTVKEFNDAAEHHKKAAAEYRKAGEPGKAAEQEEKAANDYRRAANRAKPGTEQKDEQTAAAAAEERVGDDHVTEAHNYEKCKEYQNAASEYGKAAQNYTDAANDYRATNTGHDTTDSKRAEEKMRAANRSVDTDKKK